ncbi:MULTISPECIES: hypothetical protein [Subtercola]|uniref:Uncharacterized protein n=1 Tax=Subtercola vilae TaxID=2056433 RepID=A0A4T2C9J5_9MICO|nr:MULTISPECIES: hypothetical protein [Subtercola]MEA9986837.1 hypothetical protein [Subtercola sp. RTI3]TIH40352.1 hypothetical protein D4765_02020 [Subtercola vilae]
MLTPSTWPGWVRGALLAAAFCALFVPHVGILTALVLGGAALISFRTSAAVAASDSLLRAELLAVPLNDPVTTIELEVEHPFEATATAQHQEGISAVIEARQALSDPAEPLFAALELEPNNPFDPNAVRVDLLLFYGSHKAGYVPPAFTAGWAARIRPYALDACQVIVSATVLGDGSRANPYRVLLG